MKRNNVNLRKRIVMLLLLQLFIIQFLVAQPASIPAFPGAEGAGAYASGGRDGDLYFVTNLNDSGPGSLREGIDTTPAIGRTIMFKVGGTIELTSAGIQIDKENITIAGQTAPGGGICIKGKTVYFGHRPPREVGVMLANNVIMRHLRVRIGKGQQGDDETDNIWICNGRDIILDHVSTAWSADEALSASRDILNITVQYCYMFEPLNAAGHAFGSIIGGGMTTDYSWHHNLYAHCTSRNPRPSSDTPDPGFNLDLVNCVFYNWGSRIGYNGSDDVLSINYINNYFIGGPNSSNNDIMDAASNRTQIYQSGNMYDNNKNGKVDGTDQGWSGGYGSCTKLSSPLAVPHVTTNSAGDAYIKLLALGGATPWNRDPVDKRVVATVRDQNGKIINMPSDVGGFPTLAAGTPPMDSDNDGMPDIWETAMGLNPNNSADRKNKDAIGYTMLEGYLNWLADGHATCPRNGSVDVNLQTLNGGLTFLNYTVASGSNGTATLLGDGHTVRFTAVSNFSGLANFTYSAVDPREGFGFGPEKVGVLVTGTGTGTPQPTPTPGECGDVNDDAKVNIVDALLISQYYVGLNPDPFYAVVADVNGDGKINIVDALLVAQYYVGLIVSLSC